MNCAEDLKQIERKLYDAYFVMNCEPQEEYPIDVGGCDVIPRYVHLWKSNKHDDGEAEVMLSLEGIDGLYAIYKVYS